jgi:hypothetical protein
VYRTRANSARFDQTGCSPRPQWFPPSRRPPVLGPKRHDADWDVASTSLALGWIVELRIREPVLRPRGAPPRLAFRTFNDRPRGWWSWPSAPAGAPARQVELVPDLWAPVALR